MSFNRASSFSVKFLPSFARNKKENSDDPPETEAVEEEIQPPSSEAQDKPRLAFARTQSIPVTRSEHANVPKYGSLKSILRSRRAVSKIDEEYESSGGASMARRFAAVLASVNSDTDEDEDVGNFSASERRRRDYSPPPLSRTRTAPASMQP
jgi:hypothetical protein